MSTSATFKRGSSFHAEVTYTPSAGDPTLNQLEIQSDLITSAGSTYSFLVETISQNSFIISYQGLTSDWSLGNSRWDIKFMIQGSIFYSNTMRLNIIDKVTE